LACSARKRPHDTLRRESSTIAGRLIGAK
jgi:hypothetical protein